MWIPMESKCIREAGQGARGEDGEVEEALGGRRDGVGDATRGERAGGGEKRKRIYTRFISHLISCWAFSEPPGEDFAPRAGSLFEGL